MLRKPVRLECEQLEDRSLPAITIAFNYSLDTNQFFADPNRKLILQRAAQMLTAHLDDTLAAITPTSTNTWVPSVNNPSTGTKKTLSGKTKIPANTIIVYVGGRNLTDALALGGAGGYTARGSRTWLNTIKARGEPGALLAAPTDVAPRTGSIAFDTVGTKWHFGLTTEGLAGDEMDFMSVAMHELGHILGVTNASPSWARLISGNTFTGAKTREVNGGDNVFLSTDKSHFAEGTNYNEIEAALDPSITVGERKFFGALDFAALDDIGWEVNALDDTLLHAQDKVAKASEDGNIHTLSFDAAIGTAKDVDFYRVYAGPGMRLSVTVSAAATGEPIDTYVRLYDNAGTVLETADQGLSGGTDSFFFTLAEEDYFHVAVSTYANRNYNPLAMNSGPGGPLGSYRITITIL